MSGNAETAILALNRQYLQDYPQDAAVQLEMLKPEEAASFLEDQPIHVLVPVVQRLTPDHAALILKSLPEHVKRSLMLEGNPGYIAEMLGQFETDERDRYLALLPLPVQQELKELITYPENSAGRLMNTRIPRFRATHTVRQVVDRIREARSHLNHSLFLVDESGQLQSEVLLPDLVGADPKTPLQNIARPIPAVVDVLTPREEMVDLLERYKMQSLPVINISGRLVGVVQYDQLFKAIEEEATVDMQTMVGASKEERALSKIGFAVRNRLPWLQINLLTAFLAAAVVGLFEDTIARVTALAVLLPVVAGQSGNAGAQALAVTMRGLALREITIRQWAPVLFKEFGTGFINGIGVSLTSGLGVYLWSRSLDLTLVMGLSMVLSMIAAGCSGALVPIVLRRLGQDPATASSIVLTTITDVTGFFSFLGIATLLYTQL